AVFHLCLGCFRNNCARQRSRPVPLRPLLFRHVYGRPDRGRLGDVAVAALIVLVCKRRCPECRGYPSHTNASNTLLVSNPKRWYNSTARVFASVTVSERAENFLCLRLRIVAANNNLQRPCARHTGNTQICVTWPTS